ncbi:MAG TPA: dockerin type I repeat-containing protein [Clostridia bacterium]|nr:dockerin type I repeat-containing protein [Clostridia bacterium]
MLKKIVAAFVLSIMLLTQLLCAPAANLFNSGEVCFATEIVVGDVNGDGVVDSLDFALIKAYLLKIITSLPNPSGLWTGDLNGDDAIDALDFSLMKQYLLKMITKFPKTTPTTGDAYFPAGTSKSDLISKAAAVKVSTTKALIKQQVDEHYDVIASVGGFKSKEAAYTFFFGMATRESTFRAATETGSGSAHAFGPLQNAETAYANANPSYMPETNVPEMKQYDFTDYNFYDLGISIHMGIRHLLHFARLAKEKYSGKDILRHGLMGYNTGWIDGSDPSWIADYADETASLAGWYLTNNHMSDDEFTWDKDPRVNRSNPWGWY